MNKSKEIIFETSRLLVRKLQMNDLDSYHEMQSNPKVMQYVHGEVKSKEAHKQELEELIGFYEKNGNDFWIYAIERKSDAKFLGTVAFVKDDQQEDEIGYRFIERYWGRGYGYEVGEGMVSYARLIKIPKIVGYVVDENAASARILEKLNFEVVERGIDPVSQLPETKYQILL